MTSALATSEALYIFLVCFVLRDAPVAHFLAARVVNCATLDVLARLVWIDFGEWDDILHGYEEGIGRSIGRIDCLRRIARISVSQRSLLGAIRWPSLLLS